MIRHLLKLVWNRKRANALMILETCVSFLVVFAVLTLGLFFLDNYRRPLGFEWKNVWEIRVGRGQSLANPDGGFAVQQATFERLLQEVRGLGAVEAAAGSAVIPFDLGGMSSSYGINGKQVSMDVNVTADGFDKVMGLRMVAGRWFDKADSAVAFNPIVVNQALAREVYGSTDPAGKLFGEPRPGQRPFRVIGVVSEFRKSGELMPAGNFMFELRRQEGPDAGPPPHILVRIRPGTPVDFEETLVKRMREVAPEWSFTVRPLSQVRATSFRFFLTPLIAAGTLAFFLLLMVGLGLIGVLWQNLLQRTREIGLRRAAGASRAAVHRQVILEQLLLTTLGVTIGTLLVIQVPILDLIGVLSRPVFAAGLALALAVIYLLSVVCVLYPSTLAAKVQPAEALRYE
ncbi:MAG: ABC transporter permease [Thermoanaerobaculia bacterium]